MNIALTFPDCHRRGGVERIMVECANFLARRGHAATVMSAGFDAGVLDPAVKQKQIPVRATGAVGRLREFHAAASEELAAWHRAQEDPPSVHAAFGVISPPEGVLWVQSVHAEWIKLARASRGFVGRLKQRLNPFHPYILSMERDYYRGRQYRRLIALTPRVKQELIEHYAVPENDIAILPNGFNPDEFNPARRSAERDVVRGELGYKSDDRVLLFVANELERKGFFPLTEAFAALKEPHVKLLVVGRVSLDSHQSLLGRLGVQGQVKCVGPSADVGRYFAAADLFVLPTYYEAWGLVIVEALASGIPVLTSRLAGAAAAVREPANGLLLENPKDPGEIGQKLRQLLAAPPGDAAAISRSVEEYRWDRVLSGYEAILAQHCS
ncbi:MAG TPA: glycosyltransferase family 4 protein [Phycisphaerae bacterium]|nr:glycosyltransferase family 4 protein [Phycisphaerae bacterium]